MPMSLLQEGGVVLCSGLGGNTWAPSVEGGEENQGGMGRRQGHFPWELNVVLVEEKTTLM